MNEPKNEIRPYNAIRQIFGKWKVAPDHAAPPYLFQVHTDNDWRDYFAVFDFGYAPVKLTDIRLNNVPINKTARAYYKYYRSFTNQKLNLFREKITYPIDNPIPRSGWLLRDVRTKPVDNIYFDITFTRGLRGTADIIVQIKLSGAAAWQSLKTSDDINISIPKTGVISNGRLRVNANNGNPFTFSTQINLPSSGDYDVRWQLASAPKAYEQIKVARLGTRQIPKVDDTALNFKTPHTVVEVKARNTATFDQLIDDFTAIASREIPVWDGAKWTTKFSDNPAWVAVEILRGKANPYPIATNKIDLPKFLEFAKFCDSKAAQGDKRFTVNANMDTESTVGERLAEVLQTARASIVMDGSKYSVFWESFPTKSTQVFSAANAWDFQAERVYAREVDGLIVEWIDPNLDYQRSELIVYNDGKNAANSNYFERISAPYCTRYNQAFREGRYHLAVGKLRPEKFFISTDIEYLLCKRGDMVLVQHDAAKAGGLPTRIEEVNGDQITTKEPFVVTGTNQAVIIRYNNGTSEEFDIVSQIDGYTVRLDHYPTFANTGDLVLYGEKGSIAEEFLIKSIVPQDVLTARLELIPLSRAISTADTKTIPAYKPPISSDFWTPKECVKDLQINAYITHLERQPVAVVTLDWDWQPYAAYYEIWVSDDNVTFYLEGIARSSGSYPFWDHVSVHSNDYPQSDRWIKVLPVTVFGTKAELDTCQSFKLTPPKDEDPPGKPLFFSGNISGTVMHLSWLPPDSPDIGGYVLRFTSDLVAPIWANAVTERELIPYDAFSADINARIGTYLLKTIDTSGNFSKEASMVRTTIPSLEHMNVVQLAKEQPAWTGQMSRVEKLGNNIILSKTGAGPCGAVPYGIYTFDPKNRVDLGDIQEVYLTADIGATGDECIYMSNWVPTISTVNPIAATGQDTWDVVMQVRSASSLSIVMANWVPLSSINPIAQVGGTDWSGWQTLTAGYYTGRYFQFRAILTSEDDKAWPVVDRLQVLVDMEDRIVSAHDVAIAAGGTRITFKQGAFRKPPAIATTHDNAAKDDTLKISNIDESGFDAEIFAGPAGTSAAGQIDYVAKGYGRIRPKMLPAIKAGDDDDIHLMPDALRRPTSPQTLA